MPTNSLFSKTSPVGDGSLIINANHKQAEKNLFECTKIQQPVKRWINYGIYFHWLSPVNIVVN